MIVCPDESQGEQFRLRKRSIPVVLFEGRVGDRGRELLRRWAVLVKLRFLASRHCHKQSNRSDRGGFTSNAALRCGLRSAFCRAMRSILNRPTLLADLAYPFIAKPNGAGIAAAADGT